MKSKPSGITFEELQQRYPDKRSKAQRNEAFKKLIRYQEEFLLADLRRAAELTQIELSEILDVSQTRVSQIELAELRTMQLETVRTYLEALGGKLLIAVVIHDEVIAFRNAPLVGPAPVRKAKGGFDTFEEFLAKQAFTISEQSFYSAVEALRNQKAAIKLSDLRGVVGINQTEVARRMGVSQNRVSQIENADLDSTQVDTIEKYLSALSGDMVLGAVIKHQVIGIRGDRTLDEIALLD